MLRRNQVSSGGGGINFGGLLLLVFITLKLCGVIDWSWVWVMAPMWIPLALVLAFAVIYFGVIGIRGLVRARREKRKGGGD